jgi:predicted nucleic acid-binding protein
MINLVIDSSVVIKWFDPEPYTADADRILTAYETGAIKLLAPEILPAEVGNIIWKKHTLFNRWTETEATEVLQKFQAMDFALTSNFTLLEDAYRLAVKHQQTVYDSLYLALSLRESCQFVTADERFINAISTTFSNVIWLPNWI